MAIGATITTAIEIKGVTVTATHNSHSKVLASQPPSRPHPSNPNKEMELIPMLSMAATRIILLCGIRP